MSVRMKDRVPPGGYVSRTGERQIASREIKFIGMREIDGVKYCMIAPMQFWTEEYFMKLDAANAGPIGTPQGEQWKMLIPYDEVVTFLEGIKKEGAAL